MQISRVNPYTGDVLTLEIPIVDSDYNDWVLSRKSAQEAFHYLPKDLLLFVMDGIPPEDYPDKFEQW